MACTSQSAGGVELVEVDPQAGPVLHRDPDVRAQSQTTIAATTMATAVFVAAERIAE